MTLQQIAKRTARIDTSVWGDSEQQHNACRRDDGTWITTRARLRPVSGAGSLRARPPLSRNDTGNGLRADIRDDFPNRSWRHHAAVGRHPAGAAVKNRLEQRAIGAAVAPPAVDETRSHPSE